MPDQVPVPHAPALPAPAAAAVARMSRRWALRMLVVAVAFVAFAGWCVHDARVTYPQFNVEAEAYNHLIRAGQTADWPDTAARNGWRKAFAKDDFGHDGTVELKTPWDIGTQYVMMVMCLIAAAVIAGRVLYAKGRSMRTESEGFRTIDGGFVAYADVTAIDLSRWQRKSIAKVVYNRKGRRATTIIDDWVYEGGEDILKEVQRRTGLLPGSPPKAAPGTPPKSDAPAAETTGNKPVL